ncbi:group III truncated hemoglobin [Inhella sp. 1Y17]|uniref:Group III truncated hemoglobin n=1 Tax=Inhella proteolytica TaxID=2795029 RepID=A0A931NHX3_9BURK|nr:group III truncated hemoglobin [Inhella proteolytica]
MPSREELHELVHAFYRDVRASPELGPLFDSVIAEAWPSHLDRMVEFWCTVMRASHSFRGNVFGKHMAIQGVQAQHFLEWLTLWRTHTAQRYSGSVLERLQETAAGIGRNLYYGYFGQFPMFRYEGVRAVEIITV